MKNIYPIRLHGDTVEVINIDTGEILHLPQSEFSERSLLRLRRRGMREKRYVYIRHAVPSPVARYEDGAPSVRSAEGLSGLNVTVHLSGGGHIELYIPSVGDIEEALRELYYTLIVYLPPREVDEVMEAVQGEVYAIPMGFFPLQLPENDCFPALGEGC